MRRDAVDICNSIIGGDRLRLDARRKRAWLLSAGSSSRDDVRVQWQDALVALAAFKREQLTVDLVGTGSVEVWSLK